MARHARCTPHADRTGSYEQGQHDRLGAQRWRGQGASYGPGMTVAAAHGRLRLSCRLLAGTGSVLLAVTTLSHTARAQAGCRAQDVRIELSARQVGLMVGYMWGRGVLHDGAHVYPFSVRGGGMLSLGGARVSGQGCVRNLARIRDFNGTYWTVGARPHWGTARPASTWRTRGG
ncbi:hypothetical protein RAA17_21580 [Komagataeibacter rhaeticus]|nr:hypothetical protein [Komagataeibacter rhaeticus]